MKKIIFLFILLFSTNAFCKYPNKKSINLGFGITDLYSKLFISQRCIEGCFPTEQSAQSFFTFNFLFQKSITKRLFIPLGIGRSQKGYFEKGIEGTGAAYADVPYSGASGRIYISFYFGLSYDLYVGNKLIINIGQLLNPENGFGSDLYKTWPISTQTNASFQYKTSEKIGVQLILFFQTALSPYNKTKLLPESTDWKPFGYGMTLGIIW